MGPVEEHLTDKYSVVSGDAYAGELNIRCPVCGGDYSHIFEVFTRLGVDPLEGGRPYRGTVAKTVDTRMRRDSLVIVFHGECPHSWELIIEQHKGVNLVCVRVLAVEHHAGLMLSESEIDRQIVEGYTRQPQTEEEFDWPESGDPDQP
jgi:hypothetical protein